MMSWAVERREAFFEKLSTVNDEDSLELMMKKMATEATLRGF